MEHYPEGKIDISAAGKVDSDLKLNIWLWFELDLPRTKSASDLMMDTELVLSLKSAQNIKASLKKKT